jgi:hypothetical protein
MLFNTKLYKINEKITFQTQFTSHANANLPKYLKLDFHQGALQIFSFTTPFFCRNASTILPRKLVLC